MRKIDAVLLSALIIYDYSAQSLVDSDVSNLGQTFMSDESTFRENKLADSYFSDNLTVDGEENTVRSVRHLNSLPESVTKENTISYHELAKINSSVPASVGSASNNTEEQNITLAVEETTGVNESASEAIVEAVNLEKTEATEAAAAVTTYAVETVSTENQASATDLASFDTDNDGVYDYEDKCQGIAGVARFEGCPVPDSDADGVNDEEDRCPAEAGSIENGGCPVVAQEAQTIVTEVKNEVKVQKKDFNRFTNLIGLGFNGSVLSNEDFNIVLQFADILIRQQEVKVEISAVKDNANINYLVSYLKELGVNNNQVMVSTKENDADLDRNRVYMQLKF